MTGTEKITSGESLIGELNKIFDIYTKELRLWHTGKKDEVQLLNDDKLFDIVIKLLDKSDKIKKLNTPDAGEAKPEAKIRNIQDVILE